MRALFLILILAGSLAIAQGRLSFSPQSGTVGTIVQAAATGLTPGLEVDLVWTSADPSWKVEDGRFLGIEASETSEVLTSGTVNASGELGLEFTVPEDFGYVHNVFLMNGDEQVARQGFVVAPELTISPSSGPVGTPITVTVTGVGYRFWESVWHLLYDGAHSGWLSAITTNGTATAVIPATGPAGPHTLQILSGTHPVPYLNQQQAPIYKPQIPTVLGETFEITVGEPVVPAPAQTQHLTRLPGSSVVSEGDRPVLVSDYRSGWVGSPLTVTGAGFPANSDVQLEWSSVVGNRIAGSGWEEVLRPLQTVSTDASGNFSLTFPTPDDLGGEHRLVASAGDASAELVYSITPSVLEISPQVVAPGGDITVTLKGVGWTETANIYTLLLDNGYIGYGCGFNSQGDVTIHLKAPGQPGMHYISLYPSIYEGELSGPGAPGPNSNANATYLQLPMLNAADHPGEVLPAFQLSFEVKAPE